ADGWTLGKANVSVSMPDSVHAVLAARIDRLPSLEKEALQAGAVVGRTFWAAPVIHLLGGSEPDLALLEDRDPIVAMRSSTAPDDAEYVIKHALTLDVAYGTIPKARRGKLHAALGNWLEQTGLGTDERAALLAYHYSQAVSPEDADLVWDAEPAELARLRERATYWL